MSRDVTFQRRVGEYIHHIQQHIVHEGFVINIRKRFEPSPIHSVGCNIYFLFYAYSKLLIKNN